MSNFISLEFTVERVQEYADMFKALSNPNRLKIFLELLPQLRSGEVCRADVGQMEACQLQMARELGLAPSTVSHHVKELKNAGLVTITRFGKNVDIQINPAKLELLSELLDYKKLIL